MAKLLSNATAEWLRRQMAGDGDLRSRATPFDVLDAAREYMPLDVAVLPVEVEADGGETATEQHICVRLRTQTGPNDNVKLEVRFGYPANALTTAIPVDAANCPDLNTAMNNGSLWYDTGVAANRGGKSPYFYIVDKADYTDVATSGPSLYWGISMTGIPYLASMIRYWVQLGTGFIGASCAQTFHGDVSIYDCGDNLRPFLQDSDGDWIAYNPLSFEVLVPGGKKREITITGDGRIKIGKEQTA